MKYKAVFFDFDGTLMDTSVGIFAGGKYAMQKLGQNISPNADWNKFIGPPIADCFRIAFGVKDEVVIPELVKAYRKFYEKTGRFQAVFYPGMIDVLKELKSRGYKIAIASMKGEDLVIEMCEYFKIIDLFDEILGLDLGGQATKAGLLKEGFKRLGIRPEEAVMIGDTLIDKQGADLAGCDCICVNWGFGFKKGETGTISEPSQILDLV